MDRRGWDFRGYRLVHGKTPAGRDVCEVRRGEVTVRVFHGPHARKDAKNWILEHPKGR